MQPAEVPNYYERDESSDSEPVGVPPYLNIATTNPSTASSPTACNVLMCANVVGMLIHSLHFGWSKCG